MTQSIIFRSPVHEETTALGAHYAVRDGWYVAERYAELELEPELELELELEAARRRVAVVDGSASGKILLEGDGVDRLVAATWSIAAPSLGQGVEAGSAAVFRLRPDLALVVTPSGGNVAMERDLVATAGNLLETSAFVTVTDVTHGQAELWVLGPQARALLARVCGLDFGPKRFPNIGVRVGSVAKTRQIIRRQDAGELAAFALTGDRSLGAYVWRTILEAGADLGIQPIGATAHASLRIAG